MRKTIIVLSCCTVALLLGYSSYRGYQVWKQSHWMSLAKKFAAKPDVRNEFLCLEQVLHSNPRNLEACRMMANLTEAVRSPSALIWRQRALELNPQSLKDRLALAQTAMIFKDFTVATNALEGLTDAGKKTVAYHNIAGVIALTEGQSDAAEAHFSEAARLDPGSPAAQVNLAVVRLHRTNTLDMAEARIVLKRISMNSTNLAMRCQAERELVADAMRSKDTGTALTLSKDLVQQTNSVFTDRLLRLEVLMEAKSVEFKPTLALYQRESANDPAKLYELANWQIVRTSPAEALAWLQSLPVKVQTNQPAALLIAQCQVLGQDWNSLQNFLKDQNWGELEFVRHAFLTRALRGQNLDAASKAEWEVALKEASGQKSTLISLFRLAAQWNWQTEGEDILWTIVNQYPGEQWATQALNRALYMGGRTRSLMQLFNQEAKRAPTDLSSKNNLAMIALLLNAQELKPYELARDVYQKSPTNSSYISTYAFSLYLQGKNTDALGVMEKLKPQELQDPAIAGYYGLILKAAGKNEKAKIYLAWASKAHLLPEERKLFDEAKAGI